MLAGKVLTAILFPILYGISYEYFSQTICKILLFRSEDVEMEIQRFAVLAIANLASATGIYREKTTPFPHTLC